MNMHIKVVCKLCAEIIRQCTCKNTEKYIYYEVCDKCRETAVVKAGN